MKVTVSLPDELLEAIDAYVVAHAAKSRSGVCASALRDWIQARQEDEIADYYREQSDGERREDDAWRDVATRSAGNLWP